MCQAKPAIEKTYSFKELHLEVQRMAAMPAGLGVVKGDRVLIYMPMIAEAAFAMLACARIGAIHCGGVWRFCQCARWRRASTTRRPSSSSAPTPARAAARWWRTSRCWMKPFAWPATSPKSVLMVDRGLAPWTIGRPRPGLARLRELHQAAQVPCDLARQSTDISYTIYTSGTTGRPKGVQRDTGGYAVALAASMKHIFMTAGRAKPIFPPATSAGWWGTATSSMAR
jgi:propionyl-CoA synthetase